MHKRKSDSKEQTGPGTKRLIASEESVSSPSINDIRYFVFEIADLGTGTAVSDSGCVLFLKPNTSCVFHGMAKLVHLYGPPIQITGAIIRWNPLRALTLYSPTSHAKLAIHQHSELNDQDSNCLAVVEEVLHVLFPDKKDFLNIALEEYRTDPSTSMLLFQRNSCRITDSLMSVKRFNRLYFTDIPDSFPKQSSCRKRLGFAFSLDNKNDSFQLSPKMMEIASNFSKASADLSKNEVPRYLLVGPKGSGKSSLLRFMINYFVTKLLQVLSSESEPTIAVLDCDIGQPEFTPCGMVSLTIVKRSLFGPPFTHHISDDPKPICQCFVGSISPSDDPQFYLDCLKYVFRAYDNLPNPKPPLLVNTMGWTQGLGLCLLVEQIVLVRPTAVVQLALGTHQQGSRQNLPVLDQSYLQSVGGFGSRDYSTEPFNHELFAIPSMAITTNQTKFQLGPPDHRDLTLLAYFTNSLQNAETSLPARHHTSPLGHPVAHFLDCLPYRVPLLYPQKSDPIDSKSDTPSSGNITDTPTERDDHNIDRDLTCNMTNTSDANPFQLAICLMEPKTKVFKNRFNPIKMNTKTIMACLNATLIALCSVPPEYIKEPTDPKNECAIIKSNPVCECLGLAVCRAVDPKSGILYLTTGIPTEDIVKVTGALRGQVNLPHCFFLEQPVPLKPENPLKPPRLPYVGPAEMKGVGRVAIPTRRNFPRTHHHMVHRTGSSEQFSDV